MYLYCLEYTDYLELKKLMIDYLEKTLHEHINYKKYYINEKDYVDYFECSLFDMSIESEFTSKEFDIQFTMDVYQINTNISIYFNLFTDKINDGIETLRKMLEILENLFHTNTIVLDNSSKVVYIYSDSKCYIDKLFWNL